MKIAVIGSGRSHAGARAAAVASRGHQVRFFTIGPVLPVAGLDVRTRPIPSGPLQALASLRGFLAEIRGFGADLLHLHYAGGKLGTLATLAGVHPFVVSVMGSDVHPEDHPGGLPALERRATRRILEEADLILAKSDALHGAIAAFGDFRAPVATVRWGVDPARFHHDAGAARRLRPALGLLPDDRVVLSPRQMRPLYNVDVLVRAMTVVLGRVPQAVLLLTEFGADPDYRARVEREASGLGDRVRLIGERAAAEMPALYSLAEVSVSIPSNDGLPQSLFEAMACEVPVVLNRLASYDEVVTDGRTAVLTPATPDEVAKAVVRVLTEPGLGRSLASAALARVREIALLPRELDRVDELYRSTLDRVGKARPLGLRRALDAATLLLR